MIINKDLNRILKYIENMESVPIFVCDTFCGCGGTSTGFDLGEFQNMKCSFVFACINHDKNAINSHKRNHPNAYHVEEDITTFDLTDLIIIVKHIRKYHPNSKILFHASCECINFSRAKGGMSRDADSRSLPEHLYRYIEAIDPEYITLENVREFLIWGPLQIKVVRDKKTGAEYCPLNYKKANKKKGIEASIEPVWVPIPEKKSIYYNAWRDHIKKYGYDYNYKLLNAADYGARTSRIRYFGIFNKPGNNYNWPEITHTKDGKGGKKKWMPVRDVLDFSIIGESIFDRKKDLSPKTYARIFAGCVKFIGGGKKEYEWILKYNSTNGNSGVHHPPSVNEPCPTIATQNRLGIVQTSFMDDLFKEESFLSKAYSGHPESKNSSLDNPSGTITTIDHHQKVDVRFIQQRNTGDPFSKVISLDKPSRTITTTGGNQELVEPRFLQKYYSWKPEHKVNSINKPSPTVRTKDGLSLIENKFLAAYYSTGDNCSHVNQPCPTVRTKDTFNLVSTMELSYNHKDTCFRLDKPFSTILTKDRYSILSTNFLMNYYSGGGQLGDIDNPSPAILGVPKQRIIETSFIDQQYGNSKPKGLDKPCNTITQNPKFAKVDNWIYDPNYDNPGRSVNEPGPTILASRKHHYIMNPQYTSAGGDVNIPCFTLIARMDKRPPYLIETEHNYINGQKIPSFIKVDGDKLIYEIYDTDCEEIKRLKEFMAIFKIIDIKMRMLVIPELLQIMGFPKNYVLIGTQEEKKKYIGNAVEVRQAKVLIEGIVQGMYEHELRKVI